MWGGEGGGGITATHNAHGLKILTTNHNASGILGKAHQPLGFNVSFLASLFVARFCPFVSM